MSPKSEYKTTTARHVEKYLNTFGFDTRVTPSMHKYLLDMPSAGGSDAMISSSVAARFNNIINTQGNVMSGGRVVFPAEYFGTAPNSGYVTSPTFTQTSGPPLPPAVARIGLPAHTGGACKPELRQILKQNQFGGFATMYEKKFMRKLTMKPRDKKYVMNKLNNDIDASIKEAMRSSKTGRLTKMDFEKKLKSKAGI